MARHVPGVSFRRVAFRLAKGPSSSFARALCDDGERVRDKIARPPQRRDHPVKAAVIDCGYSAWQHYAGLRSG
jgi:hypothetical protein